MIGLLGIDSLAAILAAIGGAIVVAFGAWWRGRATGKADERARNARETQERVERGREAVRDGRDDDPSDRLRRNDGKW